MLVNCYWSKTYIPYTDWLRLKIPQICLGVLEIEKKKLFIERKIGKRER